jgi:hypothetical protein
LKKEFTARSKKLKKYREEKETADFADRTDFFSLKAACFEERIYRKVEEVEKVGEKGKRKKNHGLRGQNGLF